MNSTRITALLVAMMIAAGSGLVVVAGSGSTGFESRALPLRSQLGSPDYGPSAPLRIPRIDPRVVDREIPPGPFRTSAPRTTERSQDRPIVVEVTGNETIAGAGLLAVGDWGGVVVRSPLGESFEPGEPRPSCGRGVEGTSWLRYHARRSAPIYIEADPAGSVAVFSGAIDSRDFESLREEACNQHGAPGFVANPVLTFQATGGRTYFVQIGRTRQTGSTVVALEELPPAAANDHVRDAIEIPMSSSVDTTIIATTEQDAEPLVCEHEDITFSIRETIWFVVRPGDVSAFALEVLTDRRGRADVGLIAYTAPSTSAGFDELRRIDCDSNGGLDYAPLLTIRPTRQERNGVYFVQAGVVEHDQSMEGRARGRRGRLLLSVRPISPPVNDAFVGAIPVPDALPFDDLRIDVLAGLEPREQEPCAPMITSVWYRFRALHARAIAVSASNLAGLTDSVVAVYEGSSLDDLSLIECSDDHPGTASYSVLWSHVAFTPVPGRTYAIQVARARRSASPVGYPAQRRSAPLRLRIRHADNPPNDSIPERLPDLLRGAPVTKALSTTDATIDEHEPQPHCGALGATVWYRYRAGSSGVLRVEARPRSLRPRAFWLSDVVYSRVRPVIEGRKPGSQKRMFNVAFPTAVAVWAERDGNRMLVACDDDRRSIDGSVVHAPVVAGWTYLIQVGGAADRFDYANAGDSFATFGASRGSISVRFEMLG